MLPKLTFLAALLLLSAVFIAEHCPPPYEQCGHGGGCPGGGDGRVCINIPVGGIVGPDGGCGGGGGGGGGGATATPTYGFPTPSPTPSPTPAPTTVPMTAADVPFFIGMGWSYSYDDDLCTDTVDPITVVLRRNQAPTEWHLSHHGVDGAPAPTPEPLNENALGQPWLESLDGRQRYRDGFLDCVWGEVSRATNDGRIEFCPTLFSICAESRWHARCNVVESVADPSGGTFSVCTPHWDQDGGGYFDLLSPLFGVHGCWHYVPRVFGDTWDGPGGFPNITAASGFTAGREYMYQLLVVQGNHRPLGSYFYGNNVEQPQCAEAGDQTASNGFVDFIEVLP